MKKSHLIFLHLIYWILFLLSFFQKVLLEGIPKTYDLSDLLINSSFILINIITFYFNYCIVLPRIVKKNKFWNYILGISLSYFVFIFLRYSIEELLYPMVFGFRNYNDGTPIGFYIYDNLYFGFNAIFIGSVIWFLDYSIRIDKTNKILIKEKSEAENSLLKSQINPHFVFNTLNNIYSLVNMRSDKSLMAIEKLGDLLRFTSNEITKDYTSLKNEINYVKSYIDLESIRLQKPEHIIISDYTYNKNLKIAPMLLIPFVENAFKHGDLKTGTLEISFKTENDTLYFYQKNKISQFQQKDNSSGIGIENVKKRLSLLYPNQHQLEISRMDDEFVVDLRIQLKTNDL